MAFNTEEKMALIGVLKILAETSGEITDAKIAAFDRVASSKGFSDFTSVFERVDREISTREELESLLDRVTSHASCQRILETAIDLVRSDGMISGEESRILRNLARAWKVDLKELLAGD